MNTNTTKEQVIAAITSKLARYFGTTPDDANPEQMYKAVVLTVKDILTQKRSDFKLDTKKQRGKNLLTKSAGGAAKTRRKTLTVCAIRRGMTTGSYTVTRLPTAYLSGLSPN